MVVTSADLELIGQKNRMLLLGSWVAVVVLGAGQYMVMRFITARVCPVRRARLAQIMTGASQLIIAGTGVAFVRSPLFNPGTWRAPTPASPAVTISTSVA